MLRLGSESAEETWEVVGNDAEQGDEGDCEVGS